MREQEKAQRDKDFAAELASLKDLSGQRSSTENAEALDRVRKAKEKEAGKYRAVIRKQDKLLFVGFYILLNLAEDLSVERKMIKKALVPSLAMALTRSFEDLLILCVTFLKKLSIIQENKDELRDLCCSSSSSSGGGGDGINVLAIVSKFIPCSSQPLITISLRFLFNLSFDKV